jgi:hypothetical protein
LVVFLKEEDFKEEEEDKAGEEVANIIIYVLK